MRLHTTSAELNLGTSADIDFQNFYTSESGLTSGTREQITDLVGANNIAGALTINSLFVPSDLIEYNNKTITDIWLRHLSGDTLTNVDSTNLISIAYSDPFLNGEAVYMARVILDIDPTISGTTRNASIEDTSEELINLNKILGISIYPNPANDNLMIILDEIRTGKNELIIYDDLGKLILSRTPEFSNIIDLQNFNNGIYLLVIKNEGNQINQIKFVVNHY